jgi:hypothetical protein
MSDNSIFKVTKLKANSNYDIWSINTEALSTKDGLFNVITSDLNIWTEEERQIFNEIALKAFSLIKLSLEDGPLMRGRFINNPYILWNKLKNLYEAKCFSSKFILSKHLINTTINTYKGNLKIYINNFKKLVNSLEAKPIFLPNKFLVALLLNNFSKDYEYIVAIITQTIRLNVEEIDLDKIIS